MILYFEDFYVGREFQSVQRRVEVQEILEFAHQYDPQSFHTGKEGNTPSIFDSIIASGWHTSAISMRLMADSFILNSTCLGSPGIDYIRWPNPMRPGDKVALVAKVTEARRSKSKPDRGIVKFEVKMRNQRKELLIETAPVVFFRCNPMREDCRNPV
ncbi:MAG: hypothetical protein DF168_02143 [Candidatus Moanabacter tarae]|uniref:MaoC-like domain-containing protein n=1 Tax=Candidatus Moanibacter tarae TaxID=2200854 RepID=A0A2Z4AI65_9BACT|nr:MAG: hypothetical protein DF168_02143 [Candidatus Moanabacter tarae]|tara:strand:+ start:29517 stop:29987 length:471 start_codon:yes stop_codon:yes gene_type:complete